MSDTKIDQLDIVITTSSKRAIKSLDKLTASLNAFKDSADFSGAINNLNRLDDAVKKIGSNNGFKKLKKGIGNTTKNFAGLGSLAKTVIKSIGINEMSHVISNGVKNMNDYIENMNLFTVAMGEFSKEATEYAETLQDKMGIDMSQWTRAQGVFMSMGKGFGLTTQKAYQLSKGMTEISYDISSLFNLPIEESFLKVRSGIAGEIEPLRALGYALSQATLQEIAREKGIQKSINKMTEAEKAQLRYTAIVEQSRNMGVIGDFARTLDSPANALRILSQQFLQLSRTIGSIFIPILIKVIPYIQAAAKVLNNFIGAIAKLFNFEMPTWDNKSWDSSGVESVGGALDEAADSAKKFKNAQMGFDELNVIDPNQGKGSNTGALGGGIDMNLDEVWDKSVLDEINKRTDEITEKMQDLLKVVGAIGVGFLAWKIAQKIPTNISNLKIMASKLLQTVVSLKKPIGLGMVALGLMDVWEKSEYFREGVNGIIDVTIKCGTAIASFASELLSFNIPELFKGIDVSIGDLLITAGGLLAFGPWGLAIEGAVLAIKGLGYALSPAIQQIDIFGNDISNATREKLEPFLKTMNDLETNVNEITFRKIVVDDIIENDISDKVHQISESILNELSTDRNKALDELQPLRSLMKEENYTGIVKSLNESYDKQELAIKNGENKIKEILSVAKSENRTLYESERDEIAKIQEEMKNTGIMHLSESATEANLIMNRLKDSSVAINTEQASSILQKSIETRDGTIANATEQYNSILMEAQKMLDTKSITEEEYNGIIDAAEEAKNNTIESANEQYEEIYNTTVTKMGDVGKYLDKRTGDIKSNWDIFTEDLVNGWKEDWAQICDNLNKAKEDVNKWWGDIQTWYQDNVAPKFTKEYWVDLFNGLKEGFVTTIKNAINLGIDKLNSFIDWINEHLKFSWSGLTLAGKEIFPGGSVQLFTIPHIDKFENGGFIEDGLFTMNHGEIAGKFSNGQSVVANNQQIVEGIAQGVYQAFVKANNDSSKDQNINLNVYLDGTQLNASVERVREEQGVNIFGNQIGYMY